MDLLYCLSMGSIIDYFRHYFKAYLLRVYPCEHTRRDLRLRKAEALSFPKPRLKVKSVMAVRCDLKSDLYHAGVEFASKSVFALLPDVVPNQNAQAPVQAVPSEPSMISSGGLSTTVVS